MRKYVTVSGDTWDTIAYKEYADKGGEKLTSVLIENNPAHINTVIFGAGVTLLIPEVNYPASKSLPPWVVA